MIDISLPLRCDLPTWPGSVGFRLLPILRLATGDTANVSRLDCDVHAGTHIDAPWHFLDNGVTVEQLPLDILIGPAAICHLPELSVVTARDLTRLVLPAGTRRLLLRTRNSDWWAAGVKEFRENYVALSVDAAYWVVEQGIRLIGVDYLSVQRYEDNSITHQVLLKSGVIILEGLNLAAVRPGTYELICLPLRLVGAEGAPARAVLRPLSDTQERR